MWAFPGFVRGPRYEAGSRVDMALTCLRHANLRRVALESQKGILHNHSDSFASGLRAGRTMETVRHHRTRNNCPMVRSRMNRAAMGLLHQAISMSKTYPIMTTKVRLDILDFQLPTLSDPCKLSRKRRLRRALFPKYNPPNARCGHVIKGCKVKRPPLTPPALPSRPTGSAGTKTRDIPMIGQVNRPEGFSKPSVTTGAHLSQRLSPGIVEGGAVANSNYDAGARVLINRKS
ncbi:hypothetical protein BDV19DRAFT_9037 [Aspergillus venezuelensis]